MTPLDLMDAALDALARGDYSNAIRLARESNHQLSALIEAKHALGCYGDFIPEGPRPEWRPLPAIPEYVSKLLSSELARGDRR